LSMSATGVPQASTCNLAALAFSAHLFYSSQVMPRKSSSAVRGFESPSTSLSNALLTFNRTVKRDPAVDAWFAAHKGQLGEVARHWFTIMRASGDEVRECLHDGCPVACLGNVPFAYVNVFTSHVNVGFFQGSSLSDPAGLLQGEGKRMRHAKLKPQTPIDTSALTKLVADAWAHVKDLVENG
jgi:hypothetical protein